MASDYFCKISIKTYKLISKVFQETFEKRWKEKDIFLIKSKLQAQENCVS